MAQSLKQIALLWRWAYDRTLLLLVKQAYCDKGILVDAYMHTECDDVYAISECVQFGTHLFGLVAPAYAQANVLVEALLDDLLDNCSDDRANKGADTYLDKGSDQLPHRKKTPKSKPFSVQATATKLKVSGVNLFSAGNIHAIEHGVESQNDAFQNCEFLTYHDPSQGIYQKLTLQNNRLVGAVLYGDVNDGAWFFDPAKSNRCARFSGQFVIWTGVTGKIMRILSDAIEVMIEVTHDFLVHL